MDKANRLNAAGAAEVSRKLKKTLPQKTYRHVMGAAKTAVMLAKRFGADKCKAELAGMLHDCAKAMSDSRLKKLMKEYGIRPGKAAWKIPAIWHAYAGEKLAQKEFGIKDRQVLRAIRLHSTGGRNMSRLEKIIYVSDFIEPGREYRESREIMKLLKKHITLDYLVLCVIKEKLKYLREKEHIIHPASTQLYNHLIRKNLRSI